MELQVVQPLNKKTYQLFCIQQQVGQTVGLITSHLIVMRHGLPWGRRKQNWPGLKLKQSQCSGRIRRRQITSSYEANERRRVHQRDQAFHDSLISFLFVHFLLVRHFFLYTVDLLTSVFRLLISFISYHLYMVTLCRSLIQRFANQA